MKVRKLYLGILVSLMLVFAAAVPALASDGNEGASASVTDSVVISSEANGVTEAGEGTSDTAVDEDVPEEPDAQASEPVNADAQAAALSDSAVSADESVTLDLTVSTPTYAVSAEGLEAGGYGWKSSDESVVKASPLNDGTLTLAAVADGTATVTGTGKGDAAGSSYIINVTVALYQGILRDPTGATSNYYYYVNGAVQQGTDVVSGTVDGVAAWWYINSDGMVDKTYKGFAKNSHGWWYIENGKVIFGKNGVIQDKNSAGKSVIDGTAGWWYVVGGEVQTGYTGVGNYSNSSGWWYVKNGKVDFTANTVAKNDYGWWYVVGGKVQFGYTGVGNYSNSSGWWYLNGGKVNFSFTGIASNNHGTWYVKNGKVNFDYTSKVKYNGKTYYVTNGKVITASNEAETLLYASYSYSYTYNTLNFSSSGGQTAATIRDTAESIIVSNEGSYTSVSANDNGALSIGKLQWHGTNALTLMRLIVAKDNAAAYQNLGSSLYSEIVSSSTSWSSRTLSSSEASCISSLLGTSAGKAMQDALADSFITEYLNHGYALGLRNAAALVYYADIENQYGYGSSTKGAKACATFSSNLAGSMSAVTLNELHIGAICYIYYRYSSDTTRYSAAYIPRRRTTYGTVSELGWTYCNSGDYQIPYGSVWSTNVGTKWLQAALNKYQNAGLTVDGDYGSATTAAVKAFQTSVGLTADGQAGVQTVSMLMYKLYYNTAVNGSSSSGTSSVTTDVAWNSSTGKWEYTVNGVADYTYTGFAQNSHGWWYIENGIVTFTKSSVIRDINSYGESAIDGQSGWWYVAGGEVQTGYTGVANHSNASGWWYVKNGKVDFTANTVASNKYGWWYVVGGKVQFGYTGVANYSNSSGWWYIKNGKVDFTANTVASNNNGWWYVVGGKVQFGYTGVVNYTNSSGWWYVSGGKVNFGFTGIASNKSGTWYVKGGKVQFGYTGTVKYNGKTYQVSGGKVK